MGRRTSKRKRDVVCCYEEPDEDLVGLMMDELEYAQDEFERLAAAKAEPEPEIEHENENGSKPQNNTTKTEAPEEKKENRDRESNSSNEDVATINKKKDNDEEYVSDSMFDDDTVASSSSAPVNEEVAATESTAIPTKVKVSKKGTTQEKINNNEESSHTDNPHLSKKQINDQNRWQVRFNELVEFKKKHGHTFVPYTKVGFGRWVSLQRTLYKKRITHQVRKEDRNSLTDEKFHLLKSIDFIWSKDFQILQQSDSK